MKDEDLPKAYLTNGICLECRQTSSRTLGFGFT